MIIDPISLTPITKDDLLREIEIAKRQVAHAPNEEIEVIFLQLLGEREEMLALLRMWD